MALRAACAPFEEIIEIIEMPATRDHAIASAMPQILLSAASAGATVPPLLYARKCSADDMLH